MQNLQSLQNIANLVTRQSSFYWKAKYEANELPDAATPAWTKENFNADTEEISPAGFLHLISNVDGSVEYYRTESGLDNSTGTTIEARVKMVSGYTLAESTDAMALQLNDGVQQVFLDIYSDAIATKGETYEMDTTDDYHTYRVTVKAGITKVYVDGVLRITDETSWTSAAKEIHFMGGYWEGGSIESSWDYVYYRTDGAVAPKPATKPMRGYW